MHVHQRQAMASADHNAATAAYFSWSSLILAGPFLIECMRLLAMDVQVVPSAAYACFAAQACLLPLLLLSLPCRGMLCCAVLWCQA